MLLPELLPELELVPPAELPPLVEVLLDAPVFALLELDVVRPDPPGAVVLPPDADVTGFDDRVVPAAEELADPDADREASLTRLDGPDDEGEDREDAAELVGSRDTAGARDESCRAIQWVAADGAP